MVITDKLKKLEQVNKLMEKRGYFLLMPEGCNTLEDIAHSFGCSEYDSYYWSDLVYIKHYGKQMQHTLFVTLDTRIKTRAKLKKEKPSVNNFAFFHTRACVCIGKARFHITSDEYLIGNDFLNDRENLDSVWRYRFAVEREVENCNKALNKISALMENV